MYWTVARCACGVRRRNAQWIALVTMDCTGHPPHDDTQALTLSDCDTLRHPPPPWVQAALCTVFSNNTLELLALDGCRFSNTTMLSSIAQCTRLTHLSLVGCAPVLDAPLQAVVEACRLQSLRLGGGAPFHEGRALTGPAVKELRELSLYRRTNLTDAVWVGVYGCAWVCIDNCVCAHRSLHDQPPLTPSDPH